MYRRTVLRSMSSRRAMAETVRRRDETGQIRGPQLARIQRPLTNCSLIPVQRLRTRFLVGRDRWDGQAHHLRSRIRGRVSVDFVGRCEIAEVLAGLQQDREQHAARIAAGTRADEGKSVSLSLYRAPTPGLDIIQDYRDVGVRPQRRPPSAQCSNGSSKKPRNRLCSGLEIRSLRAQHLSHPLFFRHSSNSSRVKRQRLTASSRTTD